MKALYTVVFRKSAGNWVALCLENGLVGQGRTKVRALQKLDEAVQSLEEVYETDPDVHTAPISIGELHEFLTFPEIQPSIRTYELRAVYA
jgi:predicted RNase H-like HicB family nuclease